MEDERLFSIICLLAFRPLIQGFENIGTVDLQRNLDFEKDFKLMIYGKVSGFFITIFLAFVLRDYRALIAGTLLQAATVVCFSYFFSPFRPRIKFSKIREIWAFSFWSLATNIGGFFSDRVDQAIIAHELPAQHMGAYTVGRELGAMATEELVSPPVRALFAVYAQLSNDIAALRQHYLSALSFVAIAATSTSVGVSLVAGDAVYVLLGPKWEQSVPVVPWLALYAGVMGIAYSVNAVLLATGRAYANAWRTIVFTLVLLPFVIVGVGLEGIEGAAIARLAVAIVFAPAMLIYVAGVLQMPISALASVLWRPIVAASAMAATLLYFHAYMPELPLLRLGSEALAGAAVYSGALTVLWFISGRPAGAEATLIGLLKRLVSRDGRKGT
jgi:lipopolysaccharide exporter